MRDINNLKGKVVRHFKGNLYLVLDEVTHSESGEKLILYKALYGDFGMYVRPSNMFLSRVDKDKYPEVLQEYRFQEINGDLEKKIREI